MTTRGIKSLTKKQVAEAMELQTMGFMDCEIARRMKVDPSTLCRIIKKAEAAGFEAWHSKVIIYESGYK